MNEVKLIILRIRMWLLLDNFQNALQKGHLKKCKKIKEDYGFNISYYSFYITNNYYRYIYHRNYQYMIKVLEDIT